MSKRYEYERRLGRVRKNEELITGSSNVVDIEPFLMAYLSIKGTRKQLRDFYSWFLKNGYDFVHVKKKRKPKAKPDLIEDNGESNGS